MKIPQFATHNLNSMALDIGALERDKNRMARENHANTQSLLASAQSLQSLLDGESTFAAIHDSVQDLSNNAPDGHDTLIAAFGLIIDEVRF